MLPDRPLAAPPVRPPRLSRRSLLGTAVGLVAAVPLAGCTSGSGAGSSASATPDPDEVARRTAAAAEQLLADQAAATVAAHPALAARVTPAQRAHQAHADELTRGLPATSRTPAPGGSGGPTVPASPSAPVVPVAPSAALAGLATAQTAAATAITARLGAVSPDLARLLASVAASDTAFASLLRAPGAAG